MNSDDRAYVIREANLNTLERNLNYLANNINDVDIRVEDVNEKVNKVNEEIKTINTSIKELISEIRETTILTNAKQSISLAQDEINKKYGHYDKVRRQIGGLFQAIEVGSIDLNSIKTLKEKALVDTPDYWLSSAFVAICAWMLNNKEESINALKDAIKKDDEKTSLFFSLINIKFNRYSSSFMWLKRYLDMQDASKIENKIVPIIDTLTSGIFNEEEKEYFLNKMLLWSTELSGMSNYKNDQINRWIDFLIYLLEDKNYDDYYYIKNYTNKYNDVNRLTNINISQKNIYYFFDELLNEKEETELSIKDQTDKIINLLIYNYEGGELDLRKDIAKNKFIVEENGNTSKAEQKFKLSEFSYMKNNDFYSVLSNIILQSDELKPSINTKKLSLSLLKNIILSSYNHLNENNLENINITINIKNWSSNTTDGSNEKELIESLYNQIDREESINIDSIKLFDIKMIFTLIFGIISSLVMVYMKMEIIAFIITALTIGMVIYSLSNNYDKKKEKINIKESRKKEEKEILLNILAEIVDFKFIYNDGLFYKNKIITMIKSLNHNDYIKTNNRNINIKKNNNYIKNTTDIFDEKPKKENKINPPNWDLIPPFENVRMVNRK